MKKIKLTKGFYAIVDGVDYEYLNQFNWSIDGSGYPQRATTINGKKRPIRMHRDLLNLVRGQMADHKDGNKLNDRRGNLRICIKAENNRNRGLLRNNTSGYIGVWKRKEKWRKKVWAVEIHINNKKKYIGSFLTKEEAARAYNEAAKDCFGEFAVLNVVD